MELAPASEAGFAMSGVRIHRDLIHRKRSPFSYEEKAVTRSKVGETPNIGRLCPLPTAHSA